jgi:hypothetical protein
VQSFEERERVALAPVRNFLDRARLLAASVADQGVDQNAEHPFLEALPVVERIELGPGLGQRFSHQILGIGRIARQA